VDTGDLGVASPTGALPEPQLALRVNEAVVDAIDHRWSAVELAKPPDDRDPENLLARLHPQIERPTAADIPRTERSLAMAAAEIPKDSPLGPEFDTMACWYYVTLLQGGFETSPAERARWVNAALDYGRKAVDAKPDMTGGHGCLAEVYVQTRQWDAGMSEARYVIATYAMASSIYEARGDMELAKGRFADALKDYDEAGVRSGEPARGAGLARLMMGQTGAAIAALQQTTAISPTEAWAYFYLAAAYETAGDHANALAAADQYRKLRNDDAAWRTLAMSDEPAFAGPAQKVRVALARVGLTQGAAASVWAKAGAAASAAALARASRVAVRKRDMSGTSRSRSTRGAVSAPLHRRRQGSRCCGRADRTRRRPEADQSPIPPDQSPLIAAQASGAAAALP